MMDNYQIGQKYIIDTCIWLWVMLEVPNLDAKFWMLNEMFGILHNKYEPQN